MRFYKKTTQTTSRAQGSVRHFLLWGYLCLLSMITPQVWGASLLDTQRLQFWQAHEALQAGHIENFHYFAEGLEDYPLYSYLQFLYYSRFMHRVPQNEILRFIRQHDPSPLATDLHRAWLKHLWRNQDWLGFINHYRPQKSTLLQCRYVHAHLKQQADNTLLREARLSAFAEIRLDALLPEQTPKQTPRLAKKIEQLALELWTVGKSQLDACNPAFEYLYEHHLIDDARRWQRIQLAMDNNKTQLANFVSQSLEDEQLKTLFQSWHKLRSSGTPTKALEAFEADDRPESRQILIATLTRLAKKDVITADAHWERLQKDYDFTLQETQQVLGVFALRAAWQKQPDTLKRFAKLKGSTYDKTLRQVFLQTALKAKAWKQIVTTLRQWPGSLREESQWRYWLARALEESGNKTQAQPLYKRQSIERDFYGFLAAERLGKRHILFHQDIPYTHQATQSLAQQYPSLFRARELLHIEKVGLARREWQAVMQQLNKKEMALASRLAWEWCWYDRGIFTAAKAGFFDDLNVRYPLAYLSQLSAGAEEQELDLAWVYGIIRQESAFMRRVTSSAGANGLMQVMPATAKHVAAQIGLHLEEDDDVFDAYTNIRLGTGYLRSMLDKFKGSYPLASAAYNAGPGRAFQWAKRHACEPDDIWVELIPFKETRGYVRRVAAYTVLYEARLAGKRQVAPLRLSREGVARCKTEEPIEKSPQNDEMNPENVTTSSLPPTPVSHPSPLTPQ